MSSDFTPDQKRYLEGFASGLNASRAARGKGPGGGTPNEPSGPDAIHIQAQDRVLASGGKLADQEKFKRELHPFDGYERLKDQARKNEAPKSGDNFRWRFYGLFYVAPAQSSYMCRLRIPNGILKDWQLSGLADLADKYAGGYSHVTTRANLQMREIKPKNAVAMLEAIQDLGLCSRGSGADNIRNVTGTPTAGVDPQELIDTRPYAREWHFHILNERALYGLPRKFNVGFDGAGRIPVLEDTNDIGFQAVNVQAGFGVEPRRVSTCLDLRLGHPELVQPTEVTAVCVLPHVFNGGNFLTARVFDQQRSIASQPSDFPGEIDNVFDPQPLDDVSRLNGSDESVKHFPIQAWIFGAQQRRVAE